MALPSSGIITAAMINDELGRASNAALNLNDPAVRALAGKSTGAISFSDFYGKASEIVVTLTSRTAVCLQDFFSTADWASATAKRVVIPAGVEIGATNLDWALVQAWDATGQAGSWGGSLTLENRGVISGMGGAANSGRGGNALRIIFGGRSGQKLLINNLGTIRGGGGGGGRGGNGGQGGNGVWWNQYWVYDNGGNWSWNLWNPAWYWNTTYSGSEIYWNGTLITSAAPSGATTFEADGWVYERGAVAQDNGFGYANYYIRRRRLQTDPVYTSGGGGGAGGNGGKGDGYGQGRTSGFNGVAGSSGGTNAGAGGQGGWGGQGGKWGAAGADGATGNTGAAGNNGGGYAGAGGAGGGAAGYYLTGSSNVTWLNTGTRQGSVN